MNITELQQAIQKINTSKQAIAKERDKLRALYSELEELVDDVTEEEAIRTAVDKHGYYKHKYYTSTDT